MKSFAHLAEENTNAKLLWRNMSNPAVYRVPQRKTIPTQDEPEPYPIP